MNASPMTVAKLWVCDLAQDLSVRYLWWWWLDVDLLLLNRGSVNGPAHREGGAAQMGVASVELIVWTANSSGKAAAGGRGLHVHDGRDASQRSARHSRVRVISVYE